MKLRLFTAVCLALLINSTTKAQQDTQKLSNYNYTETFAPFFYSTNGNEYRSAGGQPGPEYWQNRADYELRVQLDDKKNEISGTVLLTYTNNSPDNLDFLWMQLEQNLFKRIHGVRRSFPQPAAGTVRMDRSLMRDIRSKP